MAGNIPLFCAPGSQAAIIANLASHLETEGALICGFSIETGQAAYTPDDMRDDAQAVGLVDVEQFANWDGDPPNPTGNDSYAVMVFRRSSGE
jgi:hypothetical protein